MEKLSLKLQDRKSKDAFRSLKTTKSHLIDFSSNDYLGLARSKSLKDSIMKAYDKGGYLNGSTGSRLITGHSELSEQVENYLAKLFSASASLVFSSGYMDNLAFFSAVPQRGDTVIYDELAHACIKDGCRLSLSTAWSFKHNNLNDLESKLQKAKGTTYVACESIYSMDGDKAPLKEIAELCEKYDVHWVVDEAHSTGVFGESGQGLCYELGLSEKATAIIYTFGKGMGIHGACICGSEELKDYLINFSRPFIYTTAPSAFELISIECAFEQLKSKPSLALNLQSKINLFNELMPDYAGPSAIKSMVIEGNESTKKASEMLEKKGMDVRPILSPTVKEGTERLRICLHTYNSEAEINLLCQQLNYVKEL